MHANLTPAPRSARRRSPKAPTPTPPAMPPELVAFAQGLAARSYDRPAELRRLAEVAGGFSPLEIDYLTNRLVAQLPASNRSVARTRRTRPAAPLRRLMSHARQRPDWEIAHLADLLAGLLMQRRGRDGFCVPAAAGGTPPPFNAARSNRADTLAHGSNRATGLQTRNSRPCANKGQAMTNRTGATRSNRP